MSARDDCFPAFNKYEVEQTPEEILKAQLASLSELNAELHAENERLRALNAELVAVCKEVEVWVILACARDPETTHPQALKNAQNDCLALRKVIAKAEAAK